MPAQGGAGTFIVNIYYQPIRNVDTGFNSAQSYDQPPAVLVGQGKLINGIYNEVVFRPVDGKGEPMQMRHKRLSRLIEINVVLILGR